MPTNNPFVETATNNMSETLPHDPFAVQIYQQLQMLRNPSQQDVALGLANMPFGDAETRRALTSRNIKHLTFDGLNKALIASSDVIQIIQWVVQAIKLLIEYLKAHKVCPTKTTEKDAAITSFISTLRTLDGTNPTINLAGAHIKPLMVQNLQHARLTFVDLSNAKLANLDLMHANLDYANLRGATLKNVRLDNASLLNANLDWVDLSQAKVFFPQPISFNSSLKTIYPATVKLSFVPTVSEFEKSLSEIFMELAVEKQQNPSQALRNHPRYLNILTTNILRITSGIENVEHKKALLAAALNHPIYTGHTTAKIAKPFNKVVTSIHNRLFHHHDASTFGSLQQTRLIRALNDLNRPQQAIVKNV